MRALCLAAWLAVAIVAPAQNAVERPEFDKYHVVPTGGWLWPGRMFAIYGKNLGPAQSCARETGALHSNGPNSPDVVDQAERTLPRDLCDVQVLIDEVPVPLTYVGETQINFFVPGSRSFGEKVVMRVVHSGVTSIPASLKFGPDRIRVYEEQPAYAGMPVWIRIENVADGNTPVQFPLGIPLIWPPGMCPQIEVKYNTVVLPEIRSRNPPRQITYSGPPCPTPPLPNRKSLAGRIPLHLRYRMDRPGTYYLRYVSETARSGWMPVDVKPEMPEQRRKWLVAEARSAPADREQLLYHFLPSIFGYGDLETLSIGIEYLYHADKAVSAATAKYLRDYYTAAQLVPALRNIEQRKGKNHQADELLRSVGQTAIKMDE